jgi:hypothetical protein
MGIRRGRFPHLRGVVLHDTLSPIVMHPTVIRPIRGVMIVAIMTNRNHRLPSIILINTLPLIIMVPREGTRTIRNPTRRSGVTIRTHMGIPSRNTVINNRIMVTANSRVIQTTTKDIMMAGSTTRGEIINREIIMKGLILMKHICIHSNNTVSLDRKHITRIRTINSRILPSLRITHGREITTGTMHTRRMIDT